VNILNKKIYVLTLGCRVNIFESNQIIQDIKNNGAKFVKEVDRASIAIINTCCVTNKAVSKSRYFINKICKLKNIKLVCICGCYSQYNQTNFSDKKIGIVIGTKYKTKIIDLIKQYRGTRIVKIDNVLKEKEFEFKNNSCETITTRGFIKIQDGCNFNCSYCIIPLVRGKQRSLEHKIIISDIKNMIKNNMKEIVLTGVNTAGYNDDGYSFFDLLEDINEIKGSFRIRISSLEPFQINKNIIDLICNSKDRFCQFFHICLQNANDKILKDMNRKYTFKQFDCLCKYIRLKSPLASITTDYIVGYPSETIDNFNLSIKNLDKLKLSNMHLFPFSLHKGTKAEEITNLVSENEKKRRFGILRSLNKKNNEKYFKKFIGKKVSVLFEKSNEKGIQQGHSQYFFSVKVKTKAILTNKMINTRIIDINDTCLLGK
jgi:threonylcarbamoyladenosine tRNA methylthiotransferase MtaB